jgi:hypothetical protein
MLLRRCPVPARVELPLRLDSGAVRFAFYGTDAAYHAALPSAGRRRHYVASGVLGENVRRNVTLFWMFKLPALFAEWLSAGKSLRTFSSAFPLTSPAGWTGERM